MLVAYDPDRGPVDVQPFPVADKARWAKASNEGLWLAYPGDGADHYHEVWMLQLGGRYRFVGRGGVQYGPQHPHLCAAVYWAFGHGWIDPEISRQRNIRCQVEVRCNSQAAALMDACVVEAVVGPSYRRKGWVWCDNCDEPHPLWMVLGRTRAERLATWWQS